MRHALSASVERRSTRSTTHRTRVILVSLLLGALVFGGAHEGSAGLIRRRPKPPPAEPTTTTTTVSTPVPPPDTPGDTELTRMRVGIQSGATWAYLTLNGIEIKASKIVSTSGATQVTGLGPAISVSGKGGAVIDFILKVPKGVAPTVTTCRNYVGPMSVTLTRMTDAATVVATVNNNSLVSRALPGQCEYHQQDSLSRSALIGPVRWPARKDPRRLVLATHFPWYTAASLNHPYGDQPIGPANTNDPAVVAEAMTLAMNSGVDGFVIEYEGTPDNNRRLDYVINEASKRGGFQTALQIDLDILAARHGGLPPEILDTALAFMATRATAPSQLWVGSRPVVFVFGISRTPTFAWHDALDRLRGATGVEPFVVADDPRFGAPAIYEYANEAPDKPGLDAFAWGMLYHHQLVPSLSGTVGPLWVAPVSPGYDESRLGRPRNLVIDRNGGQRFEDEWSSMLTSLPDWVLVTSWNEYFEQNHVMPGTTTGYRALEQLTLWSAHFHANG